MLDKAIQDLLDEADATMDKAIDHLQIEFSGIRAGRATTAMVDNIKVDYYGSSTPMNQIASVSAPQPDLIVIQPWDASAITAIEKSIQSSTLGMNPSNDGVLVRVPIPPLSEERRKDLVKTAKARGEDAKVAIRNIRRHTQRTTSNQHSRSRSYRKICALKERTTCRSLPIGTRSVSTRCWSGRKKR